MASRVKNLDFNTHEMHDKGSKLLSENLNRIKTIKAAIISGIIKTKATRNAINILFLYFSLNIALQSRIAITKWIMYDDKDLLFICRNYHAFGDAAFKIFRDNGNWCAKISIFSSLFEINFLPRTIKKIPSKIGNENFTIKTEHMRSMDASAGSLNQIY